MSYANKPARLLAQLDDYGTKVLPRASFCAGFELSAWRCTPLARHLIDWIADYALREDELNVNHTNMYVKLQEAAVRIYTSEHYKKRGEVGEVLLHAICRDFFNTVPIAPRVFYLTASNEVVKSFDMVHIRYLPNDEFELWLGEAKLYQDTGSAIVDAIKSIKKHIDQGFLTREKLILGGQISNDIPRYDEIRNLFATQTSLDSLFQAAVFPVCIAGDSAAVGSHAVISEPYQQQIAEELAQLEKVIVTSKLHQKIRLVLLYVPLGSKNELVKQFDLRLKGLAV